MNEEVPFNRLPDSIGDANLSDAFHKSQIHASQTLTLQNNLIGWRDVILPLHTVLTWDKQWHPCTIIGASTIFFMSIWLLDPSLITTLSILGLTMTVSDYLVPCLSSVLLKNEPWSEKKQEKFDAISESLILYKNAFVYTFTSYYGLRTAKPKIFYGATVCMLILLAWIGNNINNLFLTYVTITFLLLIPGLEAHGYLLRFSTVVIEKVAELSSPKIKQKDN